MKRKVTMKRIAEILAADPITEKITTHEKIFITAQLICNTLDYVTESNEMIKLTDLYIMGISYNSSLYSPWIKELFNKISFCKIMSTVGIIEYKNFDTIKKRDGLYIKAINKSE